MITKNQYRGSIALKGGLGQFVDLRGAWQERGEGVFEWGEVDTSMHTMKVVQNWKINLFLISK